MASRSGRDTGPDLELVDVGRAQSFLVFTHGYPYRTTRWHFHPEYELHLITETSGRSFVGDHVGRFTPGNLVMTGPNLPHNWIVDTTAGEPVERFCFYLQFTSDFIDRCILTFPELAALPSLLADAERGIEFPAATGEAARPIMSELLSLTGARRIELFMRLLGLLQGAPERRLLASEGYNPATADYLAEPLNHALAHIKRNLTATLREGDLADLCGCSRSVFSRRFRRHTGMTFIQYVNRLRIHYACGLLAGTKDARVIDVCYQSGFRNLSNFNRQFVTQKKVTPSAFRSSHQTNASVSAQVDAAFGREMATG